MKHPALLIIILFVISGLFLSCGMVPEKDSIENTIKNASFEDIRMDWVSHWHKRALYEAGDHVNYAVAEGTAHTGKRSVRIENTRPNDARVYQYITVLPETIYKITCWIKAIDIRGSLGANIAVLDSSAHSNDYRDTGGKWEMATLYGMTAPYQTQMPVALRIGSWAADSEGAAFFDDIRIEQVTGKPANSKIHSFAFNENYSDEKADEYFARVNNIHYTRRNLHMSLFISLCMLAASICFSLYMLILRGKNNTLDTIVRKTFTRWFYVPMALFFVLFFIVHLNAPSPLTALDVQLCFALFVLMAAGIMVYLYRLKQLTWTNVIKIVIFLGIALRLCYFLYSPFTDIIGGRQHDLWGAWSHTEYIKYMGRTFLLPPVGTHEAYHPPLHYLLSGIVFRIAESFGLNEVNAFRAVQVYLLFISAVLLLVIYRIFLLLKCDERVTLIGMAFACFLPSLIFMSVYLNNDMTLAFFYTISFYYLLKWAGDSSVKHTVLFAVFAALSVLSKKSALIIFLVGGIVFLVELVRNRIDFKRYIRLALIFLAIAVPLGLSFQIRNYILFQQDLGYAVSVTGPVMPSNPYNLFYVSVEKLLEHPFVLEDGADRIFLFMEFIRTSVFGVFFHNEALPGIGDVAVCLMFFYLITLGLLVLYFLLSGKGELEGKGYILFVNFAVSILFYIWMHFSSPYHTTHAFRYIAPFICVSFGYYIGKSQVRFGGVKYPVLRFIVKAQFIGFCIASAAFIMSIGF
ncbi:MAG: glycosyltransferase family 39 protein [Spirochaetales bacterium]|nr:glycosyltransferase family 39 protein [Spirochaetales bacterium]